MPVGAVLAAVMTTKKRRHTAKDALHSAALVKRFQHLCRKTVGTERREEGVRCSLESCAHTLVLQGDVLRGFCLRQEARLAEVAVVNPFRRRVLRCVAALVDQLDQHDTDCPACVRTRAPPRKKKRTEKSPTTPPTNRIALAQTPSLNRKAETWSMKPAPPAIASIAKVFTKMHGQFKTEEPLEPVYVDTSGRAVVAPNSAKMAGTTRRQQQPQPSNAAATCGFLTRIGNRCGVVPAKRVRRSYRTPTLAQEVSQEECRQPKAPTTPRERVLSIRIKRADPNTPLGLTLSNTLVLQGVRHGSPAGKVCGDNLVNWTLSHVGGVCVGTLAEAEEAMEGALAVKLRFKMPRQSARREKAARTLPGDGLCDYVDMLATTPLEGIPSGVLCRMLRKQLGTRVGATPAQPRKRARRLLL